MAVAKSIAPSASLRAGTNGCATRVLGDLKVAATNAKPKRAGQAPPLQTEAVRLGRRALQMPAWSARQSGGK